MDKSKILKVELSAENPAFRSYYYATLELPAKEYEIRDALQQIRATDRSDGEIDITVLECPMMPDLADARIDFPTLKEMEFFAKRLAELDENQQSILQAVASKILRPGENEIVGMKDLINMTYGLDSVSVLSNVTNDEQLGEFVIENDMQEDVSSVPENAVYLLDKKRIGKLQREMDGGVFSGKLYVCTDHFEMPKVYDGNRLPADEPPTPWYAFGLKVTQAPAKNPEETAETAEWIYLPMTKTEANRIAGAHGAKCIEDCVYFDFESSVSQINVEMFGSMEDFDKLNALAERMAVMSPTDQIKFKAALCLEEPKSIVEVLDISEHLHEYELSVAACDADDFFKEYLAHHLPTRFDSDWLHGLVVRGEGIRLLDHLGGKETAYGMISGRGRSLYELVPYDIRQEKELTTQSLTDEKLDVVEVLGQTALFTNGRVTEAELPDGLFRYDLVEGESLHFAGIKANALVNHGGTVLLKAPLDFCGQEYIVFDEETSPNFLGYDLTPQEFMDTDFTQNEDENEIQDFGGMQL